MSVRTAAGRVARLFSSREREIERLRDELQATRARAAGFRDEAALAREAQRVASGQHAQAAAQHAKAAAQHAQSAAQHALASEQLWLAQDQLRHALAEVARLSDAPVDPAAGPSLFLCTLPKSGTIYLTNLFLRGLGLAHRSVTLGCFPRDLLDWQKVRAARAGAVVHTHLDASPANLQVLRTLQPRAMVHLRDPRQAALSFVHHARRLWDRARDPAELLHIDPAPPADFYARPLDQQVDWVLDLYLPACVQWVADWLAAADGDSGVEVLVTTFDEMTRDERGLVRRVLAFFGHDPDRFDWPAVDRAVAAHSAGSDPRAVFGVHFRQGTPDEWRGVFTPAQRDRATAQIPAAWKARFGWTD